jgi:Undecaprenyl-phosphate glucose phosphotransferase
MSLLGDRKFENRAITAMEPENEASVFNVESLSRAAAIAQKRQQLSILDGQPSWLKRSPNQGLPTRAGNRSLPGRGLQIPCAAVGAVFGATDAIAIILSSLIGAEGYQLFASGVPYNLDFHVGAGVTAAMLYVLIGKSFGFYQAAEIFSLRRNSTRVLWQWLLTSLLLALLAFLFRIGIQFSRASIVCFAALGLVSLFASRSLMKSALNLAVRKGRVQGRRVVLLGLRDELANVVKSDLLRRFGLTEVERVAFPNDGNWSVAAHKAILAALNSALISARDLDADQIVLALRWNDTRGIELLRDKLRDSPLPVMLLPDRNVRQLVENPAFSVRRSFAVEIQRMPLSQFEQFAKRALDLAGAALGIVLLAPLMLLTALAIKLDSPGPVLFRQQRSGFNAKRFMIFKFRSMLVMEEGDSVNQVTRNDPRVSRIGRLIRATSVDELPQLFNVLLGDMSLVGPRPHAVAHDSHYGNLLSEYAFRHHVKPGITGWAQIHGARGGTAEIALMKSRLDLDLWYINNWSLGIDIMILIRTIFEVVRPRNAY